jgi:4-hydroxy 2-oxovalerate aldolase
VVIAMNTQADVASELVDLRIACHPVRLLADCGDHTRLPQPLITPFSMLPEDVRQALANKQILDFGMQVEQEHFAFGPDYCVTPTSLVMAYAFAVLASGKANCGFLAGFDGYPGEDPRNEEMNQVVKIFRKTRGSIELIAITPTRYDLNKQSIYGIIQ